MNAWFYAGGGMALYREVYAPFNVVPFPMGNSGVQMAGWFRKEIKSMADFKGLKMRIPGLGGKVLATAGGTPVLLAGGEIYTALERGTIDATEWVGPYHDLRLGLYRAAKHYYYPGWHEPGTALELAVNKKTWAGLTKDFQSIIETTAQAVNLWMLESEAGASGAQTSTRSRSRRPPPRAKEASKRSAAGAREGLRPSSGSRTRREGLRAGCLRR
jgi:TRAP-type mannitol/chloroaromatic compound transport system substrate-binding protein